MVRDSMKSEYDLDHQIFNQDYSKSWIPINKNSQIITKIKPKIRIIHIFAPEIINTDTKNFRNLVQSLTGKPEITKTGSKKNRSKPKLPDLVSITPQETGLLGQEPGLLGQETGLGQESEMMKNHVVKEEWGACSNTSNTYFDLEGLINLGDDDFSSYNPLMGYSYSHEINGLMFNS